MRPAWSSALLAMALIAVACGPAVREDVAAEGGAGPSNAQDRSGGSTAGDRAAVPSDSGAAAARRLIDQRRQHRLQVEVGDPVPDFAFTDLDGVERHLSDYRGNVVLLDFWGIWCKPCVAEVPHLVDTYERFHERGFEIIGVNYRDDEPELRSFLADNHMTWVQTREGRGGSPIHELYTIRAWPSYYLIDESGNLLALNPRKQRLTNALETHFGR